MSKSDFETIVSVMDSNLKRYNERNDFVRQLDYLKKMSDDAELTKLISYEMDSLNFYIYKGELIPLNQMGNLVYPNINNFSIDCKFYLQKRFKNTKNNVLKNMYCVILLNLKGTYEERTHCIDESLDLINQYLNDKKDIELLSDLLITTFDKSMSLGYKKEEIKSVIIQYIKMSNDEYNVKDLIELMISKKKIFKKDDFEEIESICWNFAKESNFRTKLEFLTLGQKVSNKLKSNNYSWNNEFGKTYEELAYSKEDSKMIQIKCLTKSLEYYKKAKNTKKIDEISIKLKKIQNKYELPLIPDLIKYDENKTEVMNRVYENIFYHPIPFINYLISGNKVLIPKLEKTDKYYQDSLKSTPILAAASQIKFDNNMNIRQIISNPNSKIKNINNKQYSIEMISQKTYLNNLLIFNYYLGLFTCDSVISYLTNYKKFINIQNNEEKLFYYIKPVIQEYFTQMELYLENKECNFVLFIDSIVSKIELIIRKICEHYDVKMIKSTGNGTTSEMLLHDFFNDEKFKEILSEKDQDFIKHVLLEPGLNLRNKSAHCFDLKIYNFDNANLLILCFFRLLKYL